MTRVSLYGLTVETDIDLHGAGESTPHEPDVQISLVPYDEAAYAAEDSDPLLEFDTGVERYTLTRREDERFLFRMHGFADIVISRQLDVVELGVSSAAPAGMAGVITTGAVLSLLLYLGGQPVLHGSAVEVDGRSVAFVGRSGQGKTTMATLFCRDGASVITDDVLVIDDARGLPSVRRGSRELRLRESAGALAAEVGGAATRRSADDRVVVAARAVATETVPLAAIVVPAPTRDGSVLRFERLASARAMLTLVGYPRLLGWRDPDVLTQTMGLAAAVAERVPVYVAYTPWGPPFPTDLARRFFEEIDR